MEKKKVKNISGIDLSIVDVGICKVGEVVEVPADFHNANFEEVKSTEKKPVEKKEEDTEENRVKKGEKIIK
jgi:hypothetical protein